MKLSKWKKDNRYTNKQLEILSGIHEAKFKRIVKDEGCVKLSDAYKIIKMTKGDVNFCDLLLEGDC